MTRVSMQIFDLTGRVVRVLIDGQTVAAGRHRVEWDGQLQNGHDAEAGVYFFKLETSQFNETKRMILTE